MCEGIKGVPVLSTKGDHVELQPVPRLFKLEGHISIAVPKKTWTGAAPQLDTLDLYVPSFQGKFQGRSETLISHKNPIRSMGIVGEAYGNRVPQLWVPEMYGIYIFGGNTTI